ncbi:MAG: ATP-binding cassette domain-containing protein, partial [Allorhizobium sp.]|uniref:ATP-binding cassette domain-containing protein n=1 Tax=Allorhizobium sp. TaxID=633478 RepID=UPI004033E42F
MTAGAEVTVLPQPILSVKGATIRYETADHRVTAVQRASFEVHRGDRFVLLGPSGCGKSTLLKAVAGFVVPAAGEIELNGRAVRGPGPDRIMDFQEFDQ